MGTYGFPSATNMLQLVWDDELAEIAQAHSNQCIQQHDKSGCRGKFFICKIILSNIETFY